MALELATWSRFGSQTTSYNVRHQSNLLKGQAHLPRVTRYLVDGNVSFLTATESAWRRQLSSQYTGGGLIVAIGYPLTGKLYDFTRRNYDLTPPPVFPIPGHGGADEFLEFIDETVRPTVKARYPEVTFSREALYGHSYGGIFALHALFTRPTMFSSYFVSSPSIFWNGKCIMVEAKTFMEQESRIPMNGPPPSLAIFWGSHEQTPPRNNDEQLEDYEKRIQTASDQKMADNAFGLCQMLRSSNLLENIKAEEFLREDHVSITPCSVNRSLITFFEDWAMAPYQASHSTWREAHPLPPQRKPKAPSRCSNCGKIGHKYTQCK